MHVSLDLDALDPEAPGVGTPVPGGLTYREAHLAWSCRRAGVVGSLEMVEVNPILDLENVTAAPAVELAASAFGLTILSGLASSVRIESRRVFFKKKKKKKKKKSGPACSIEAAFPRLIAIDMLR